MNFGQIVSSICIIGVAYGTWRLLPARVRNWGFHYLSVRGQATAQLTSFDDESEEEVSLLRGQVFRVDCQSELQVGSIHVQLLAPGGEVLDQTHLSGTSNGQLRIFAPVEGTYLVRVTGEDATGAYHLKWSNKRIGA